MKRRAVCSCGQLAADCSEDPLLVSACHCAGCQRRTGSAFGLAAFFPREAVSLQGDTIVFVRTADNGHAVTFHFCPFCGSTVCWEPTRKPDLIAVAVGAFADPSFPAPSQSVFEEGRHPWVEFVDQGFQLIDLQSI